MDINKVSDLHKSIFVLDELSPNLCPFEKI